MLPRMILFLLFAIPVALFTAWFGWHAWRLGRRRLAIGMLLLSLASLSAALLFGGWMWLVVHR